ncbi:Sulphur transport [Pseudorhodobacter antarcticus]|uniref:Sulphur transport n=1 Tax=Pseudorhodobacter antarcticus TaxID=1077947 RepID=A0A1H8GDU5_9RHOB|nr:YeeE/YedE thiosulfate transporter family protein [Pseudorhodobacter antarcticus]SEN41468.1 Sulphur transport [Pseudorhodobacter antarcticus]
MFETLGFDAVTPRGASVMLGLVIGLAFGAMAETTRFCLRRGLVGAPAERKPALALWAVALAAALLGTQGAVAAGWISFDGHRLMTPDLPVAAIVIGGLAFGAGMVLTRGCASRLTVLSGTGNLRALMVLGVFAIAAHATMKGLLAPLRTSLGTLTVPMGEAISLAALPGGGALVTGLMATAALAYAATARLSFGRVAAGVAIGLLVPLAWVGTGFVLLDEFDLIAMESLSFTLPLSDTLFWAIASSSVAAGFGTGLFGGTIGGAALSSLASRRFKWESFSSPAQTGRYALGGALMGMGGVLAGGCTLGAGLAGVPTLSVAALLALAAIVVGGVAADRALNTRAASPAFG